MTKRVPLGARSRTLQAALEVGEGKGQSERKKRTEAKPGTKAGPFKGLSIRLTPDTHDALRKIAFEKRVSIHSLFLEGVDFVLKKYGTA